MPSRSSTGWPSSRRASALSPSRTGSSLILLPRRMAPIPPWHRSALSMANRPDRPRRSRGGRAPSSVCARYRRRQAHRPAGQHRGALYHPHSGPDEPDRHKPGRQLAVTGTVTVAGTSVRRETRLMCWLPTRTSDFVTTAASGTAANDGSFSFTIVRYRWHDGAEHCRHRPERRHRSCGAHRRLRLRARHAAARRRRPGQRRQRSRQLCLSHVEQLPARGV